MAEIKVSRLSDAENIIGILINNGYSVQTKAIMKKFPEERRINYYEILIEKREAD